MRVVGVDVRATHPGRPVVVTAGAWTDPVLRALGLGLAVEPQRGQIVHLRLEGIGRRTGRSSCRPAATTSCRLTAAASSPEPRGKPGRLRLQDHRGGTGGGAGGGAGHCTRFGCGDAARNAGRLSSCRRRGAAVAGMGARHRGTGGRHRARGGGPDDRALCRTVAGGTGDRAAAVAGPGAIRSDAACGLGPGDAALLR